MGIDSETSDETIDPSTRTEESLGVTGAVTSEESDEPKPQFGLRGLLLYMFLCSLYFSQLSFFVSKIWTESVEDLSGPMAATIWITWLIFGAFYVHQKLGGAVFVHCFLHVLALTIALVVLPVSIAHSGAMPALRDFGVGIYFGGSFLCLIANLFSFPGATLMLPIRAFKVTREFRF